MRYDERFTERVCLPNDEIAESATYIPRIGDNEIILQRLGLYEDLGFSPGELAEILLSLTTINANQMELIKIAQKRIRAFDNKGFYLNSFEG